MTLTQPNRFLQFLAARGMAPVVPGQSPFTPNTGFTPLPPNPYVPNTDFGPFSTIAPPAPMQTVPVTNSRYGTPTEFVPQFQIPVNLNVPVWQPPPGYIPPNPNVGVPVPAGGFPDRTDMNPVGNPYPSTVRPIGGTSGSTVPIAGAPASPATTTVPSGAAPATAGITGAPATVPATQPPLTVDPTTTYPIGTPIPAGSVELPWTTEGTRQVKTPDGAIRQVDGAGNLAGSGVEAPTESITILPGTGVVQVPGGSGRTLSPTEMAARSLDAEGQAAIAPYVAEMTAMGLSPQDYLGFLTTRAQTENRTTQTRITELEALQEQRQLAFTQAYQGQRVPEAERAAYLATQTEIDALRQGTASGSITNTENTANWGYANQATALFGQAGLTGGDGGGGGVIDTITAPLDYGRGVAVTGVGNAMLQVAEHPGNIAESSGSFLDPVTQNILDVTFDPAEAARWAAQNPDLVRNAAANGYDSNGDGTADFTGGRAVWELYAGTKKWYERAGADILLDPLTYVGGVATIGRRIAGEVPEAATAVRTAVNAAHNVAPAVDNAVPVADNVVEGFVRNGEQAVPAAPTVNPVRRAVGTALQVPDLVVNQAADRVVGGALGAAGNAIRSTPGVNRLFQQSDRVQAEVARDEGLAAIDRTTALNRRQAEFEANRTATTVDPAEIVPGVNDGVTAEPATVTTTTDLLNVTSNPDAVANRRFNTAGEHVDDVVDPLAPPPVTPEARPVSTAADAPRMRPSRIITNPSTKENVPLYRIVETRDMALRPITIWRVGSPDSPLFMQQVNDRSAVVTFVVSDLGDDAIRRTGRDVLGQRVGRLDHAPAATRDQMLGDLWNEHRPSRTPAAPTEATVRRPGVRFTDEVASDTTRPTSLVTRTNRNQGQVGGDAPINGIGEVGGAGQTTTAPRPIRPMLDDAPAEPATVAPETRPISTAPEAPIPEPAPTVSDQTVPPTTATPEPPRNNPTSTATNPLDARFREIVNMPWKDGSSRRADLYRAGIIAKRVGPDASEATKTAGRKYVELIEAAWRRADDNTKSSAAFQREIADAEEVHAVVGRRGETSQNLPLAWERASDRAVGSVSQLARESSTSSSLPISVDRLNVPLGERDRGLLSEVLTADSRSGAPEESLYDRFRRHTQDGLDQGANETEATDRAMRLTGDDFLRSRGITPNPKARKGLGWWEALSGKVATGMLYKPTTLLRRGVGDTITDEGNLALHKKWSAMALSADPKLAAEGFRAQQGTRSAEQAFGQSEASRIIADTGSGTRWRSELSQERASVDRATGRQAPSTSRQREIAGDDPEVRSLVDRAKGAGKTVWSEGPKAIINGLGSTRRMAVFADHLATNLPLLYRRTQEAAVDVSGRYGFQADDALVSDAFTTLLDRVHAEGRAGFDAVDLREALRTSARNATSDAAGSVSVGIERNIDRWANDVASKYQDGLATLNDDALSEVNRVLFSWRPTNIDEAISKVFFFHYYMTRQSAFYATEGLKNPVLAANYFRAQDGLDRVAEEGDYPAPVKGFIKLMGGDLGYALYWNPGALAQTYATFRDAAPDDASGRNTLETIIEQYSPGMLNPLITTTLNAAGLLPSGQMTDPLMTSADRRLVGNAVNWGRANGYLSGSEGGILDTPYQNLLNRVRDTTSTALSPFLGGLAEHVESTSGNATRLRQLNDYIVMESKKRYPGDEDRALTEAAIALHDPESDLYQDGYRAYTDAQLIGSLAGVVVPGQPTTRAASVDNAAGYVETERDLNPTLTSGEIAASDPTYDAAQVERTLIPTGNEDATGLVIDQQRAGNVGTPEGRNASTLWNTIALFDDPEAIRAAMPQGVTVGGTTYAPEQIVALPDQERMDLADQVLLSQPDGGAALVAQRTARDTFAADHPEYARYADWRTAVREDADLINTSPDSTSDQRLIAWADRQARTNQNFGTWWRDERARIEQTVTDPAERDTQLGMSATSSDAYLSYQGIKPDVYAADPQPMLGPDTLGGSGGGSGYAASTPVDLRAQLETEAAQYRADVELTNQRLRDMTGDPDLRYELLVQDPQGGPAARVALERRGFDVPRMGSSLFDYSNWLAEQAPGSDISFDAYVRYANIPKPEDVDPTDALRSRYEGT